MCRGDQKGAVQKIQPLKFLPTFPFLQEELSENDLQALLLARDHCLRKLSREHQEFLRQRASEKATTMSKLASCCVLLWTWSFYFAYFKLPFQQMLPQGLSNMLDEIRYYIGFQSILVTDLPWKYFAFPIWRYQLSVFHEYPIQSCHVRNYPTFWAVD